LPLKVEEDVAALVLRGLADGEAVLPWEVINTVLAIAFVVVWAIVGRIMAQKA
jgi:hypothetical protein